MYKAFVRAKSGCDKWHDYEMSVAPYETDKPIYYEFTACPAAGATTPSAAISCRLCCRSNGVGFDLESADSGDRAI